MKLFIPYLATSTNVGTRQHWTKRKREVDSCHLLVRSVVKREGVQPIGQRVDLVFRPRLGKGVRRRDTSNYSLNVKHLEDGEPPEIDRGAETGTWIEIIPVQNEQQNITGDITEVTNG